MKLAPILPIPALGTTACQHANEVRHQPPTAAEIEQKIIGTWFLDQWSPDGTPKTITVTFGADGSFESPRNFADVFETAAQPVGNQAYNAMWHATDGLFTVTTSNAIPNSNLQMFVVDHLDDNEMVCGRPSVGGRDIFRR